MKLESGKFETEVDDGMLYISISQESDISKDGGYTFEDVTHTFELNKNTAKDLLTEINEYLELK